MEGADDVPTVCLLGGTGTGKSSTGNSIFKQRDLFEVSDGTASTTSRPAIKVLPWRGHGEQVRCVDLPGLADTMGRDLEHVEAMAEVLKGQVGHVHVFLLIINSQVPKFDIHLQGMLKKFRDIFGEEFLRNVMLGFTRWEFQISARKRRERRGQTEAKKAELFNFELRRLLGHSFDCPCIFLDNSLTEEDDDDLEERFQSELPDVKRAFEMELQKVHSFMRSREPFLCRNIEAALAERESMKQWVRRTLHGTESLDQKKLGRPDNLPDKDTFKAGWLRWRRPPGPPRSIWAVLRRQQLQFFVDDGEAELAGPEKVELSHTICGKGGWHLLSGRCFLIYKPVRDASKELRAHTAEKYEFGVDSEHERRKWMFLVQEATQISESWSRILAFYESLHSATKLEEYIQAIRKVVNETMVIPMDWVRHWLQSRRAADPDQTDGDLRRKLEQAQKDLARDEVILDARVLRCPSVDDLATDVVLRVLRARTRGSAEEPVEERALLLARDVVLHCSRSIGGVPIFDAVEELFKREELVHTVVDSKAVEPVRVRIQRPDGSERVLQQDFLLARDASSGLPQFESDASAAALDIERVRSMSLEEEQRLQVTHAGQESWVPDWESLQCMKCGVQFGTWVRRHHCRHCGALICSSCSQHSVELVAKDDASRPQMGRVCFMCYQKAVITDLNKRKAVGAPQLEVEAQSSSEPVEDVECDPRQCVSRPEQTDFSSGSLGSSIFGDDDNWPVINVEMTSTYILYNMELRELFRLHCKYVRQVRWSGVSAGRIVISIEEGT